jgi:preprotein translocase subunit SecY
MFNTILNVFKVPELRNKVLFTLFMLLIYRIGYHVTIPGADQEQFAKIAAKQSDSDGTAAGRLAAYISVFSGGNLNQSTIFGLGVMPYISASIIMQLLTTVVPTLEKLQKEGETGRRKIIEWTRFITIPLCVVQAVMWLSYMANPNNALVTYDMLHNHPTAFWLVGTLSLTAGSVFLMWVGEQIDEYGLGNGTSMIILAGIVARMPNAVMEMANKTSLSAASSPGKDFNIGHVILLAGLFVFIIAGSILVTQAQRRIPITQAKHTRGRKVYGGQKSFLPLRVNHGGVMPIIFAQSLMLFPGLALDWIHSHLITDNTGPTSSVISFLHSEFQHAQFLYTMTELTLIYFFAYFWTTVQFQPKEMANQLRDYGSFIPGIRPGPRTAAYLEKVMMHITFVGAGFLCIIAVIPMLITTSLHIPPVVSQFLGGTGLLIVVSVALDVVQRIEANHLMRNYSGFLAEGGSKGKRIRGRQY